MIVTPVAATLDQKAAPLLMRVGQIVARYGLVVVLAWIGFGKYVKMEARVLIEHSPLMSWIYDYLSVTAVARGLGTMEIVAALHHRVRPRWPRACLDQIQHLTSELGRIPASPMPLLHFRWHKKSNNPTPLK